MTKTSIIFPTTGRKNQAIATLKTLVPTIKGRDVEVIVVVDADPLTRDALPAWLLGVPFQVDYSEQYRGISGAFSAGLARASGEYIAICADDLEFTSGWLEAAYAAMESLPEGGGVVTFNDGHHDGNKLGTHYMISRWFIERYLGGRISWDAYKHSMHDVEINERAKASGRYIWAEEAYVYHKHWNFGERPQDATDLRNLAGYEESARALQMRQALGWPDNEPAIIGMTEQISKKRIGYLMDAPQYKGGAEMVAEELAARAPADFQIVPCPVGAVATDVDAYVLHNCVHYPAATIQALETKPVIKVVHDEWPHQVEPPLRSWILQHAKLLVFSSPLHRDRFKFEVQAPTMLMPPFIDAAPFVEAAKKAGTRKGACFVGRMWPGKGIENVLAWGDRTGTKIDFYGFGPDAQFIHAPHRFRGEVDYAEMPGVLAKYEQFVFLPDAIEPFSRTTVEAWLAGCKLVVNRNVGALHWIENDPGALLLNRFWETVREQL